MRSPKHKPGLRALPVLLLATLAGSVLATGAAWALAAPTGGPPGSDDGPVCHGHGQIGLGECVAEARGPGRGRGFGPGPGSGRGRGPHHGPGGEAPLHILDSMPDELALTDGQWADVLAVMGETRKAVEPLMADRTARHEALRALMHADPLDEAAIRESAGELAEVQAELAVTKARTRARLVALLDSGQKAFLEESRAEYQNRRERHRKFHRQMRGGQGTGEGAL